jgi:hypothetical protein
VVFPLGEGIGRTRPGAGSRRAEADPHPRTVTVARKSISLFPTGPERCLGNCLVALLGTRIGTPTTTVIPTMMGTQATAYLCEPASDRLPRSDAQRGGVTPQNPARPPAPLRYVGVPPASRLGRGSDAVRRNDAGNWVTTAQPGGRSWAARLMRLRRHSHNPAIVLASLPAVRPIRESTGL